MPRGRNASLIAHAHLMARAGPSKVASTPSPALYVTAAESRDLAIDDLVVPRQEIAPPAVTDLGDAFRGCHDVRKEHRGQSSLIDDRRWPFPRQELLYLADPPGELALVVGDVIG